MLAVQVNLVRFDLTDKKTAQGKSYSVPARQRLNVEECENFIVLEELMSDMAG